MNPKISWVSKFILLSSFVVAGEKSLASENEKAATKAATTAFIIQSGVDTMIKDYVKAKVHPKYQEAAGQVLKIVKIVESRRIELEWKF